MFLKMPVSDNQITKAVDHAEGTLRFSNCLLSLHQYEILIQALNNKPTIKNLELNHCEINEEACKVLAKSETLHRLLIFSNRLDDRGIAALAANTNFRELKLESCNISSRGAIALAQNDTLSALKLHNSGSPPTATSIELAEAFAKNTALRKLELYGYAISDEGAKKLALNANITELSLPFNQVAEMGATALSLSTNLIKLNLDFNGIGDRGAMQFIRNRRLQLLSLNCNSIDRDIEMTLQAQIELNKKTAKEWEATFIFKVMNIILACDHTNNKNTLFKRIPWDLILIILEKAAKEVGRSRENTHQMASLVKDNIKKWDPKVALWDVMTANGIRLFKASPNYQETFNRYMEKRTIQSQKP